TMDDVNVNAPADQAPTMAPPTRTDDQIPHHIRWAKGSSVADSLGRRQSSHIDYAERIWEEFTQSIHTFIEDKKNLAQHTHGKKKATIIVILDYQFSAKETKREVFGMPIPGNLITADIQGSDPDSPAPKPTKATKKSKPSAPKADLRPPVTKPASSQQPEPKLASAKSKGKKRKLVMETSDKPSPARKSRPGLVTKQHKPTSSLRLVDESVAKGIPEKEPRFDEEADVKRALKESLKSIYDAPRGPLPLVVIRKPESGKYQPLPEVQGKGKEKVTDVHVALDLLTLQTPKKKSLADQFIFQRRTSTPTGSSGHDESLSLYAELGLTESKVKSDEDVPRIDAGVLDEGQARPSHSDQNEGQAGPNPDEQDEGQARPNPCDAAASQPLPSPIVHAGPNLEHMDLEVIDVSTQPHFEQIDEGFTTTAYPKVQENLKLMLKNRDLPEADMKEILHQRIWDTNSYKTHNDHMMLCKALKKSMNCDHTEGLLKDLAEACKKKKKRRDSPKTPPGSPPHQPPPPPPAGPSGTSRSLGASGSSQVPPYLLHLHPPTKKEDRHATPEPAWSILSSYLSVPKNNWASALASTYSPPPEDSLLVQSGDMAMFMDWFCKRQEITKLKPQDLEGPAFELVKVFHPNVIHLQYQIEECHKLLTDSVADSIIRHNVSKPLPLGGQPGQVTIQSDFFFNKDLEYLRYGSKGRRSALSISKMKVAYYPDVGLKQIVLDQMWLDEECKYDIAAIVVRTHMRILSVVRIKVFSMYGYDYMKKIVLRHLNHLPPKDKKILTTAVNLWTTHLDATGFEYKHDYTVIDSSRAITFWNRYGVQMIMQFNEIHKFSDGTLHQIDEALDYRVKEFKVNRMNPGLNTRFWTRKDVDRSKEFMFTI
nr:hypothetical protein [Tanacetum cinerariifolium]